MAPMVDRTPANDDNPVGGAAWRDRAVERSTRAARQRAATRVQQFLDAARDIIVERSSIDFTVQEVVDRSKQSLRSFYQFFDGKHELLLALFEDALLVPVPKSAPLTAGALWASDRIAKAMCHAGFGRDVAPLVERVRPVATSHLSAGSERAWPDQHRDSVTVGRDLPVGFAGRLVLVDDVVTRGSTLLSCALALLETYPQAEVTGFAVARTVKGEDELPESTVQPVLGTIDWRPGWIERTP